MKRDAAISKTYGEHGYTLSQIGDFLGLHYAAVSRIVKGHSR